MQAGRAESDARPQAEKQRAFRRRMQQQRDVRLPILQRRRHGASHLKPVVDAQRSVARRVLNHSDRGHDAFAIFNQAPARWNLDEPKVCGQREKERECAKQKPPPPAGEFRRERQIAKRNQNQRPFGSDERKQNNAKKR